MLRRRDTVADDNPEIAAENVNLAGGSLTEGHAEYLVRIANQFGTPEEMTGSDDDYIREFLGGF